jgi:hypothetical protein
MIQSLDNRNGCTGVEISLDMGNDEYHAREPWVSRSKSFRYRGAEGGIHQRYEEKKRKRLFTGNRATSFGTLVDVAFEATAKQIDWRSRCAVPPSSVLASDGSRRGKPFTEWRASLPPESIECSEADFGMVSDIIEAIREHKAANALLEAVTHPQYSVFLTDENGHERKSRADGVTDAGWFDLKTTSSDWSDLRYSFRRFGYDWQAAWYSHAAFACGWEPFEFKFIVVQSAPPHAVRVIKLPERTIARAASEIAETLDRMRARREADEWIEPSYHEEFVLDID